MAISVTDIGTGNSLAGNATVTITGVTVPAGSLIYVGAVEGPAGASYRGKVADGTANSYLKQDNHGLNGNAAANGVGAFFYVYNCAALSSATITYTKTNTTPNAAITAFYATGVQTTSDPFDVENSAIGNSGTPSSGSSGTPTVAGELFVGLVAWKGLTTDTFTQDSTNGAYASPPDYAHPSVGDEIAGGFLVNSGVGALTYAPTITSNPWAAFIVGFKPVVIVPPIVSVDDSGDALIRTMSVAVPMAYH